MPDLPCAAQVRRDFGDLPLLKSITGALGPAMWFNAIVVLTHAAAAPPDNASGAMSYEMYASNRTHLLQQSIRCAPPPRRCVSLWGCLSYLCLCAQAHKERPARCVLVRNL